MIVEIRNGLLGFVFDCLFMTALVVLSAGLTWMLGG